MENMQRGYRLNATIGRDANYPNVVGSPLLSTITGTNVLTCPRARFAKLRIAAAADRRESRATWRHNIPQRRDVSLDFVAFFFRANGRQESEFGTFACSVLPRRSGYAWRAEEKARRFLLVPDRFSDVFLATRPLSPA